MNDEIHIIPSAKIDKPKWDDCVDESSNAIIYAQSFYLDCMSDNWCGIIVNDYETVMPICFRKKLGIKYCYDVPYVQQLGWFSKTEFKNEKLLLKKLFSFCKYGDYNFNFKNNISLEKKIATNFIIDLSQTHDNIQKKYATVLSNNINRAQKEYFIYSEEIIEDAANLNKLLYGEKFNHLSYEDYENFLLVAKFLENSGNAFARKVTDRKKQLLANVLLFKDEKRIYNIINNVTQAGRKLNANHFLYDNILKEFAQRNLIFDFEGSDLPGVKKFYEGFGAVNQPYFKVHFNKFPFPLSRLKS